MVSHFATALAANYIIHGVDANLYINTAADYTIRAIDKTAGTEVMVGDQEFPSVLPAATVLVSDLTTLGVTDHGTLIDATLTINSVAWEITNTRPRATPGGESAGELLLVLRKVL